MKTIYLIPALAIIMLACHSPKSISKIDAPAQELVVESIDSTEYDLIVLDARFETFLASQPYSKEFYSDDYYKNWNYRYCVEWNIRHSNPLQYGDFYETQILYDNTVDYGIDFNFKLYQYFQFIDKEYGIILIRRRGR